MPQMFPMNWLILLFTFSFMFLLIIFLLNSMPLNNLKNKYSKKMINFSTWLW